MKAIATTSLAALALAFAGASLAIPGPGWNPDCPYYDSGYGKPSAGSRYYGAQCGFGAQRGCQQGRRGLGFRGRGFQTMMQGLELTPEQRVQVDRVHNEYRDKMIAQRSKMLDNRASIRLLNRQYPVDQAEVQKLAQRQGELVSERIALRAEKHAKIQQLLTDEQRARWQDALQMRQRGWRN